MSGLNRRQCLLAICWLAWAVVLLGVYYTRLWRLCAGDTTVWEALAGDIVSPRGLMALLSPRNLPALGQALSRTWKAVSGSALVLLVAQGWGAGLCRLLRWSPEDWREGLLYRTTLGLGALSYLSLGLAALGLYHPTGVRILIVLGLVGGGSWCAYRLARSSLAQAAGRLIHPVTAAAHHTGDWVWKALILWAVLIALVGALAPEIEYDALWYHLWLPKLWLAQGRPVDLIAEYISLYPKTWELLYGAGLVLGGPVAAKLLHFACLLLTVLLTYQLAHRFVPQTSPWLAAALFVTVPTVLWEATTAYVDLALTLHVGLAVYALLRYVDGRRWQWLGLAALNLGLALATKHLALIVLVLATGGLALRLWLQERNLRQALVPAALLGGLSLLLPLPWYLWSARASGNPMFPDMFGLFGAWPPERWSAITERGLAHFKAHFGRPRTPLNLLALPWDMTVHAARYGGTLGPLFLLLLPGLAVQRPRARAVPWLMGFVLLYIAFWASPLSSFQIRFLIPITPFLAALAAAACADLTPPLASPAASLVPDAGLNGRPSSAHDTRLRWLLGGALAFLLLLNLPPCTSLHERDRAGWEGWLTHVVREAPLPVVLGAESEQGYLAHTIPSYAAWQYINAHLPTDARVLTFSGGDHFYSERERVWSDATIAHLAVWGAPRGQEAQALEALYGLNVSHVLFDKRQLDLLEPGTLAIAQPSALAGWYDLVYEDRRFVLYRLRWETLRPQLGKGTGL